MENTKTKIRDFTGNIRDYIETRIDMVKLDAAETGASAASSMVAWLALSIFLIFTMLLLSIGIALMVSYAMGNMAAGFFIVAGFYLLLSLLIFVFKDKWIRKPLVNAIVKNIYGNE